MKPEPTARRHAAVLVLLAAALWWHFWMPGVILAAFILWAVLHRRYQGARRDAFMRVRSRLWPPSVPVLLLMMIAGTAVYALSEDSMEARILPIALNIAALVRLVVGSKRALAAPGHAPAKSLNGLATIARRA